MADRKNPVDGLLIPDPRTVLFSTLAANDGSTLGSDYTEATPRPGISVPGSTFSRLAPQVSGAQAVDVDLRVVAAGLPALTDGVELAYRLDGDTDDEWRGWLSPNFIAGMSNPYWTTFTRDTFDAATIPSTGEVVIVATGPQACSLWDPLTWTWAATTAVPAAADAPSVLVLPGSERILYLALPLQQMFVSEDKGTTWEKYSEDVFRGVPTPATTIGARMHFIGSDISLITYTATQVRQWVSTDLGTTFVQVEAGTALGSSYTTTESAGKLILGYINTADSYPCVRIVGAAGAVLADADEVNIDSTAADEIELVDQDGVLWAYIRTGEMVATWFSGDQGLTWTQTEYGLISGSSASDYPTNFRGVATCGHVLLLSNWVSSSAYDKSIFGMVLGGWSTVTNGDFSNVHRLDTRAAWGVHASDVTWTWLPAELPQNNAWTHVTTGGTTTLVSPGAVQIVTTAQSSYYVLGLGVPSPSTVSRSVEFEVQVDSSSGGLAATVVGLNLQAADGTNDVAISIAMSDLGFRVSDIHAASTLGDVSVDMTEPLIIWATVGPAPSSGYEAEVFYRRASETKWTTGFVGAITSNTGAPAASAQVQWGNITSGTGDSTWHWLGAGGGQPQYEIDATGGDLNGKPVSTIPSPVPDLAGGVGLPLAHLSAQAGPGVIGEEWSVPRRHDYSLANILPSIQPSPSVGWRSQDTTEQIITWDYGSETFIGDSVGVLAHRVNFSQFLLEYWDGATWQTAGTADLRLSGVGSMAVDGDAVRPTGGTGGFQGENELAGGTILLGLGGGVKARRIRSNTAGVLTGSSTTKQAEILIDGVDGTEPSAPATNSVIAPSGILLVHLSSVIRARYWRVRIPAQTCADSYFEAGCILPMRVQPFGASSSWGGGIQWVANTEITTSRSGTTRAKQKGPIKESWTLGWPDPTEQWRIRSLTDLPYVGTSSGLPLAVQDDVARLLRGVLEETRGGEIPVVGLAAIPATTSTIRDQSMFVFGRMSGNIQAQVQQGSQGINELLRVETITLDELV